jgi:hypothetical protein
MSFFRPNSLPDNELIKIMEYIFEYFIIINKIFLCEWGVGWGWGWGLRGWESEEKISREMDY